jgi:flagellar biosynthesis/type III secretory pathway chaperone
MIRAAAHELAERLAEVVRAQEALLGMVRRQRPAIVEGRLADVDAIAGEIELEVRRLAAAERARATAAEALADELGLAATRWSAMREALSADERAVVSPRVDRVEALVRDIELANAVNGQLVRRELELLDLSVRSLAAPDPRAAHRAYGADGGRAAVAPSLPMLLNTAA